MKLLNALVLALSSTDGAEVDVTVDGTACAPTLTCTSAKCLSDDTADSTLNTGQYDLRKAAYTRRLIKQMSLLSKVGTAKRFLLKFFLITHEL